ncbi:MAG: DNA-3-methyladenine glycosylase 2 [Rickettsiaceae bacterium]|jgi:DNA-3-methyladenine glycosylase II|nr:DNA-3-methyladenine glycosylase 2 [Rickettsiaceae bacterium]
MKISIKLPFLYSFSNAVSRIQRGFNDPLNLILGNSLIRAIQLNEKIFVLNIFEQDNLINIEVNKGELDENEQIKLIGLMERYLGLDDPLLLEENFKQINSVKSLDYSYNVCGYCSLFEAFVQIIIGQLISVKAANSIKKKFIESFGEVVEYKAKNYILFPDPNIVKKLPLEALMAVGLSKNKSKAITDLAFEFSQNNLENILFSTTNIQELKRMIGKFYGIGTWSSQWFLLQGLRYFDSIPSHDLVVRKAFSWYLDLPQIASYDAIEQFCSQYNHSGALAYRIMYNYLKEPSDHLPGF